MGLFYNLAQSYKHVLWRYLFENSKIVGETHFMFVQIWHVTIFLS